MTNPSTFLLDEPLSSLDAKLRRELRAECDRLHEELKRTFIYVTHDQEEAMTLADRIVVMRGGEIEQVGSPMEIYSNPVSYFVADFFGSPSMNLVAGEIVATDGAPALHGAGFSLPLPDRFSARAARPRDARHPARARRRPSRRRAATSRCRCGWSSRSARTRCSISMTARERAFVAVSEGLAMAEPEIRHAAGLDAQRPTASSCSAPTAGVSSNRSFRIKKETP